MPVLELTDVAKRYDIVHNKANYLTLREVITGAVRKPFKYIAGKIRRIVAREGKEEFWALKNINFTVDQGEAVGIIGPNGSGKTTLLKLISRITPPTAGEIKYRGKVASLLEVGTGFHPELTGRENIFLNGAILGMSKREIESKFDHIVEFAGIERFLDTPVKRYSSGMYVRLAFSVAAHLEPDILLVDEVLAVGDAVFQKKCLGKMDEVMKMTGRTILFVSHDLGAIQSLCSRCIWLHEGEIRMMGQTGEVVHEYRKAMIDDTQELKGNIERINRNEIFAILNVRIGSADSEIIKSGDELKIDLMLLFKKEIKNPGIVFSIKSDRGIELARFSTAPVSGVEIDRLKDKVKISLTIEKLLLTGGRYILGFGFTRLVPITDIATFTVEPVDFYDSGCYLTNKFGYVLMPHKWKIEEKID